MKFVDDDELSLPVADRIAFNRSPPKWVKEKSEKPSKGREWWENWMERGQKRGGEGLTLLTNNHY